jgi:hypothetical protein
VECRLVGCGLSALYHGHIDPPQLADVQANTFHDNPEKVLTSRHFHRQLINLLWLVIHRD